LIESARRHHTAGRFIWARIRRVYPTFIVLQVLIFSVGYATHAKGLGEPVYFVERLIFGGLMLPGVLPIDPIQTGAWTLSFEAAFYLLVASMRRQPECPEWLIAIILLVLSTVFEWWDTFAFFALGTALWSGRIEPPRFLGGGRSRGSAPSATASICGIQSCCTRRKEWCSIIRGHTLARAVLVPQSSLGAVGNGSRCPVNGGRRERGSR
jgi:hypothetical protein